MKKIVACLFAVILLSGCSLKNEISESLPDEELSSSVLEEMTEESSEEDKVDPIDPYDVIIRHDPIEVMVQYNGQGYAGWGVCYLRFG